MKGFTRAIIVYIATALLLTSMARGDDPRLAVFNRDREYYDITQDGGHDLHPGDDIAAALRDACFRIKPGEVQRALYLPAGEWELSSPVTFPHVSGFTFVGAGVGATSGHHRGVATRIKYTGEETDFMFRSLVEHGTIGNFTMEGKAKVGILIDGKKGLGTGKSHYLPIEGIGLIPVQTGAEQSSPSGDCIHFDAIYGEKARACLRMVNAMGMSISYDLLHSSECLSAVEVDGGGILRGNDTVVLHRGTLLKINKDAAVGKNNAFYQFTNTKVDAQADDGFTLVDSASPNQIRVLFVGGVDASEGTKLNLTGSNFVHLQGFSAKFEFKGETHPRWGTPAVLLDACRCWNNPTESTNGVNLRMRDCTNWQSKWLDDGPTLAEVLDKIDTVIAAAEAMKPAIEGMRNEVKELEKKADKVREALGD